MTSQFKTIAEFNENIGNAKGDPTNPDWSQIDSQLDIALSEVEELKAGVSDRCLKQTRDGAGDVLVTVYGLLHRLGIDADRDLDAINASNDSKFCTTIEEAVATSAKYEAIGIVTRYNKVNGRYAVVSAHDQCDISGGFYPAGKLLKSVNYHEPEFYSVG
jgi:hypothetical protein